jgi:PAS domain S-box-containing protein
MAKTEKFGAKYDPIAELVKVNPVPSIIVNMETLSISVVNAAAIDLLGYSEQELLGRSILEVVPPEDIASVEHAADEPPPEGETYWRCLKKDGTLSYLKLMYRETVYQGRPARFIVVVESAAKPFERDP